MHARTTSKGRNSSPTTLHVTRMLQKSTKYVTRVILLVSVRESMHHLYQNPSAEPALNEEKATHELASGGSGDTRAAFCAEL